ncbi:hypothetical protein IAT38_000802 [Cryptococcus sp. DSM 104549]
MRAKYKFIATLLLSAMVAVAAPTPLKRPAKRTPSIDTLDLSSGKNQAHNILSHLSQVKDKSRVINSYQQDADGPAYDGPFPHARRPRPSPASSLFRMTHTTTSDMPAPECPASLVDHGEVAERGDHWWDIARVLLRSAAGAGDRVQKGVEDGKLVKAVKKVAKAPKRPKEVVVVGEDMLGRRIVKRGTEVFIEEPYFQGRQWQGAEELDDETDEPYWDEA